ncbi:MAG: trigger factor [Rubricoccaceae bacterium]
MQTDVRALSEVDYALDVHVPAAALAPRVLDAVKKQRASLNLKGFRPGKVPLALARKMLGPQLAVQVAEEIIGEAYREAVVEPGTLDVIGQPRLDTLELDPQNDAADLRATVLFSVRPAITLADTSAVTVSRLVRTLTEEDIDADIQRRRDLAARVVDADPEAAVSATDVAVVDVQPVNADGEPIGPVQHGAEIVLANPDLRAELREALLGRTAGETVQVDFPHAPAGDEANNEAGHAADGEDDRTDRYRVTITKVRHRVVPEADEDFVRQQTGGRSDQMDDLREQARAELDEAWNRRSRQALENRLADAFVRAHSDFPVPAALVESILDQMVEELTEKGRGPLPEGFDLNTYREERRAEAEAQVRWLLLKDRLIREEGLEVTEADFDAEFARMAGEDMEPGMVRSYFAQQPRLLEQLGERMLNTRVFEALERRFTVVDKTREDLEREAEARRAEAAAGGDAGEPAAGEPDAGEA